MLLKLMIMASTLNPRDNSRFMVDIPYFMKTYVSFEY